jgi:hypothetical protein
MEAAVAQNTGRPAFLRPMIQSVSAQERWAPKIEESAPSAMCMIVIEPNLLSS